MNMQPGWERKKAATRAALATTAAHMFKEHGFDGVTANEIAQAAGVSERTFFRYFETKEDVLFYDIRQILDELRTTLAEPAPDGQTRRSQIEQLIVVSAQRIAAPGEEYQAVSIANWLHEPAINLRFLQYAAELEQIMVGALASARDVDPRGDLQAQLEARMITGAYQAAFAVFIGSGGDLVELMDRAFAVIDQIDTSQASRSRPKKAAAKGR